MRFFHDEGIVLRKRSLKEKDEVILLLTKHHGKMAFMSYGSRDPKSRKSGVVELFNTIAFEAREGKSKMPVLQQVKSLHARAYTVVEEGKSLEKFYRASELLKLTDSFIQEEQNVHNVYNDLELALNYVHEESIVEIYWIRLLDDLGFVPHWGSCCQCHEVFDDVHPISFSVDNRGFLHRQCASDLMDRVIPVELPVVKTMKFFQQSDIRRSLRLDLPLPLRSSLRITLDTVDVRDAL